MVVRQGSLAGGRWWVMRREGDENWRSSRWVIGGGRAVLVAYGGEGGGL